MADKRPNAVTLLEKDHEKVRGLLKKLESARSAQQRQQLLDEIETEVKIHSKVEEEIFYPAYKKAARTKEQSKLFFEAAEEHHLVDIVLDDIKQTDPESDTFAAKAKVLKDLIEHHADEEEGEMFPFAKKLLGKEELEKLGGEIEQHKQVLQAHIMA